MQHLRFLCAVESCQLAYLQERKQAFFADGPANVSGTGRFYGFYHAAACGDNHVLYPAGTKPLAEFQYDLFHSA